MATRNELRAMKVLRLLNEAQVALGRVQVFDRAANEAKTAREALQNAIGAVSDFVAETAEYTADELREDGE